MGKRSAFERFPRDAYDTPPEAVRPLLAHLKPNTRYVEPCAGKGRLIEALDGVGHNCVEAWDIEPGDEGVYAIERRCALESSPGDAHDCFITNPPWDRKLLHPMIERFTLFGPTWLLFDADWSHTRQSAQFMPWCRKIVSVGRVVWIPGTKMTGKDNCAWYLFDRTPAMGPTMFFGRESSTGPVSIGG